ncbi:MAG TPA: SPOR domain-containing protein [Henriciella sp.]|nr:SPOR domain-containing protein [Henriciella sp.]
MALNANAGLRALAATTLFVSIIPTSAYARPREAAPIDFVRLTSVEQIRRSPVTRRVTNATPRLNPNATQDTWRGPVTQTGSGALPEVRRRIDFSYPGSVRTPVSLSLSTSAHTPPSNLGGATMNEVAISSALSRSGGRMVAGHPSLPLNSLAHVRNPQNNAELVVYVTSRTAARREETLTLSPDAAELLGISRPFGAQVMVESLGPGSPVRAEAEREPLVLQASFEPEAPAERQVSPPAASGSLFVQIGSFTERSKASDVAGRIGGGLSSGVQAANVKGQTYHRVMVGPFKSRDAADRARASLRQLGFRDGFVTSG